MAVFSCALVPVYATLLTPRSGSGVVFMVSIYYPCFHGIQEDFVWNSAEMVPNEVIWLWLLHLFLPDQFGDMEMVLEAEGGNAKQNKDKVKAEEVPSTNLPQKC